MVKRSEYKIKTNVRLPLPMYHEMCREAERLGISNTRFVTRAIRFYLSYLKKEEVTND